ncbi:hypothetical protein [Marivita sp.]|uniref:hypothetical protein n=1 Tax=Marivita sp. TaxID=2003365 RepID=UPI0025C501A7|nr:hypothetical protein [Marivita sp.]
MRILTSFAVALLAHSGSAWAQDPETATLVAESNAEYGAYVAHSDGRPVYAFLTDYDIGGDGLDPLESCDIWCRDHWPLVKVERGIRVGDGLDPDLVETRSVGGEDVLVYAGRTLFHFYRDTAAGMPNGQGVYSFGGYWALITPSGSVIRTGPMDEIDQLPDPPD